MIARIGLYESECHTWITFLMSIVVIIIIILVITFLQGICS